jgi:hypothetical protein
MWCASRVVLLVCCFAIVGQAAIYDTAPVPHDVKTKTVPKLLLPGISPRNAVSIDISNMNSWDEELDASNERPSIDVASLAGMAPGSEVTVVGIGWDISLQTLGFSWFSETVIKIGDDLAAPSLFLQPGVGDDFGSATAMNYTSGGLMDLTSNGLPDMVLSDGVADFEFYELFDDVSNAIDAAFLTTSTITFQLQMTNLPGDFDGDGDYACADVDALVDAIVRAEHELTFDLTGDDMVDTADLSEWLALAGAAENASGNPYLPGDANLSGVVDFLDFNIWAANRFTSQSAWCLGDFNATGIIDFLDFNIWAEHRFQSSFVPEPSAIWLLLIGGAVGCRRRHSTDR